MGGWEDGQIGVNRGVDAGEMLEPGCYWFAASVGILTTPLPDAPFGNFILGGNQSSMAPGQSG